MEFILQVSIIVMIFYEFNMNVDVLFTYMIKIIYKKVSRASRSYKKNDFKCFGSLFIVIWILILTV